jgi:zinc protease
MAKRRTPRASERRPARRLALSWPAALALVLTMASGGAPSLEAQQAAVGLEPVASVEGITEYRLENGLRVLLFPDPSKPLLTVNITYLVGSRHEGYGETGMAHLLEHLLFRGSAGHPDIDREMAERGAQANGTTWYDRTNYYEIFPASGDNLEWAFDLEADRMVNSFVRAEDLASEMTVVRNEMEARENDPLGMLTARTLSTAYLWHNYGKSTIGARSDVENVPIERLRAFYRKYYQPDNALLVVAGNFDEDDVLDLVIEKFGRIPRPNRAGDDILYPTYTVEPVQDGERRVTLRRVGEVQHVMSMYHMPPGSHPDYAAVEVLAFVLGDNPSGRLYRSLVEGRLATRVSADSYQLREAGPLLLSATADRERDLEGVLRVMNETVEAVVSNPVTETEVARAKASLLTDIAQSFNSSAGIALQLSEWAAMGDWRLFFLHRDRIEALTAEDVNRVARAYLKPDNRTVGLFFPTDAPDRAPVPGVPDIEAMVAGYTGREAVAAGEAFDPSPANIEARTIRYTLANGMKVALLPKRTRGNLAMIRLRLAFGDEQSLMNRSTAAELAGAMLMRGTVRRTRQDIQDELDRLQASGSVGGTAMIGTGQFQTVHGSVAAVIRLMAELVREPAFPESELELLKEQNLARIAQSRTEPDALASLALARHMSNWPAGHPNYVETFDESAALLRATTLADVRAFHADFWGPQNGNIVVVGDFDEEAIRRVIDETFADWRSPRAFRRVAAPFYDAPGERIEIHTPDKANAFFLAQQNLRLSDQDGDYPALLMAGYMLGGGMLNSRLARRIRTQDGLSYGIGADVSAHPVDPVGQLFTYAIYAPENAETLEAAFVEEVERALREGFTEEELQVARQGWLEARQLSRAQDSTLASAISQGLYFDRTMMVDDALENRVRELELAEVNRVFRERIDLSRMTFVKAGDFGGR